MITTTFTIEAEVAADGPMRLLCLHLNFICLAVGAALYYRLAADHEQIFRQPICLDLVRKMLRLLAHASRRSFRGRGVVDWSG